jgi:hypothetical protein
VDAFLHRNAAITGNIFRADGMDMRDITVELNRHWGMSSGIAANAVSHGVLSRPDGSVALTWQLHEGGTPQGWLSFAWRDAR